MSDLITNNLDFGTGDNYVLQDARVDSMYTNAQIDAKIPTVNDSTITIKQGTTTKGTFTLNQSSPATITLDEGGSQIDELGDIGDVNLVNLTDGQQIHWDADSQKWINADGVEFRTLTQAQYDALPNTKLTDGVFYYITDSTDEEFIDDDTTSSVKTWSSDKIDGELDTLKTSLNGLDLSNMIRAVTGRATLQTTSMTQVGNMLIVNVSVKIDTALTAYQTGVIQFVDAKYKPKKDTYAVALKNNTPFICGINASTGEIICNHGGCAVNDILYFDFMYMM